MGNYSKLISWETYPLYVDDECGIWDDSNILWAKYSIPLFWLSMYSRADIQMIDYTQEAMDKTLTLIARTSDCLENLKKHKEVIFSNMPLSYLEVFNQYSDVIKELSKEYLQLDFSEMLEPRFKEDLNTALDSFETNSVKSWKVLFEMIVGINWDAKKRRFKSTDNDKIMHCLCGCGNKRRMPWDSKFES